MFITLLSIMSLKIEAICIGNKAQYSKHEGLSLDFDNACKSTQLVKMEATHMPISEEMIVDIMNYSYKRMPHEILKR